MAFRRAYGNYVNLGKLYSIPPWGIVPPYGLVRPQSNSVNLGNLYSRAQSKRPSGWAYFEDGSVFILPFGWCAHNVFESRMKIAAHFVNGPTPRMQQVRAKNSDMKRFVVINKDGIQIRNNTLRILARNAQEGQRVSVVDPPFENVELSLDPTGSHPVSARFSDAPQLRYEYRLQNSQALETFRGTLVGGILQPNVRLGNGLRLSNKPEILKPQITAKRRARNQEARRLDESGYQPLKSPVKQPHQLSVPSSRERTPSGRLGKSTLPPRRNPRDLDLERREAQISKREQEIIQLQQQLLQTMQAQSIKSNQDKIHGKQTHDSPDPSTDAKLAVIEARERALEQKEELLRYKRKTWLLEQKLAQVTARSPPRREFRGTEAGARERDGDVPSNIELDKGEDLDSGFAGTNQSRPRGYNLDDTTPPEALERLRSGVQLPTRRMMMVGRETRRR
ncbi:hypothetical protein COCVIDRAFT_42137 [Bipolaris victoriae FI3]|uniref:Uncharacterized protein n=1 Tax=Bipolaris victoriae (strain FI3) TaxID=930091 RepID=W7E0S2_BIPV3|nr:hypothetical protein COCVIDRAFT_42137 [Bipolaris victoriae FI3]